MLFLKSFMRFYYPYTLFFAILTTWVPCHAWIPSTAHWQQQRNNHPNQITSQIDDRSSQRKKSSSSSAAAAKGTGYTVTRSIGVLRMIESINVETLSDDHELVGTELATSIRLWLDNEWMPQLVHEQMAQQCKMTYITCRNKNENDLMAIMTYIADDLNKNWKLYNKDAFVNAWDIANYVSDYLTAQISDAENCGCSSKIY